MDWQLRLSVVSLGCTNLIVIPIAVLLLTQEGIIKGKLVNYFYYIAGLFLVLIPNFLLAVTLPHWPTPADNRMAMARTYIGVKNLPAAEAQLRQALEEEPKNADVHGNLAVILLMQNQAGEGIAELQTALRIAPHNSQWRWQLGSVLMQVNRQKEGLAQFQQATFDNPASPDGHYLYANALMQTGSIPEAIDEYKKALQLVPDNETLKAALEKAQAAMTNGNTK